MYLRFSSHLIYFAAFKNTLPLKRTINEMKNPTMMIHYIKYVYTCILMCLVLPWLYRMLSYIYLYCTYFWFDTLSLFIVNFINMYLFRWVSSPSFTVNDMVAGVSYNLAWWYTPAKLDRWLFNAFDVSIELLSSAIVVCFL